MNPSTAPRGGGLWVKLVSCVPVVSPRPDLIFFFGSWQGRLVISASRRKQLTIATAPPEKFVLLLRYNLFIGVNKMHVKNITVTVSVRVSVTVGVSLVCYQ